MLCKVLPRLSQKILYVPRANPFACVCTEPIRSGFKIPLANTSCQFACRKMTTNAAAAAGNEVEKAQKVKKSAAAEKTIFGKIADKEIKADIIYEDNDLMAFNDVNPQAPCHFLVIPKKPIATLDDAADEGPLLGKMLAIIPKLAAEQNLNEGYRVVINNGKNGAQSVLHLHIHVLGKRQMGWPPG